MKNIFLFLVSLFLVSKGKAQPAPEGTNADYLRNILKADVLTGASRATAIAPNLYDLCFDKTIKLNIKDGIETLETCIFINTRIGYIGYFHPGRNAMANCNINPNREKFLFTVISLKGNTYYYQTIKKKGNLEYWVTTFNTDYYPLADEMIFGNEALRKTNEVRQYGDAGSGQQIEARCYQYPGDDKKYFIYGNSYPQQLLLHSQKFLGNFQVGYHQSNNGLCLIMEVQESDYISTIVSVKDVQTCFNPDNFKEFENEFLTSMQSKIEREKSKLQREHAAGYSGPCILEKNRLLQVKMESLARQEENLSSSVLDNTIQNDPVAKALASSLFSAEDQMQILRFTQELKICQAQDDLSKATNSAQITYYTNKLSCLRNGLAQLSMNMSEMQRIDREFEDNPARQWAEKSRAMTRNFNSCGN